MIRHVLGVVGVVDRRRRGLLLVLVVAAANSLDNSHRVVDFRAKTTHTLLTVALGVVRARNIWPRGASKCH